MAVQHFSRSARTRTFRLSSVFAIIAAAGIAAAGSIKVQRSEERRVGKECRSRWSPYH